jgi:hypothetical protein
MCHFELSAALSQQVLKERVETIHVPESKKALDVAGKKGIQPLAVK